MTELVAVQWDYPHWIVPWGERLCDELVSDAYRGAIERKRTVVRGEA